jgi:transcriptional regulator with XRE-family HTH domain
MSKKSKFELAVIEKIRNMRIARKLSQEDIAVFINTTRGFVGQVESEDSRSRYSINHLNKIAIGLKCSPQELIPYNAIKN